MSRFHVGGAGSHPCSVRRGWSALRALSVSCMRRRRNLLIGLAIWSVLLASLAPTFSQLIARGRAIEICSAAGTTVLQSSFEDATANEEKNNSRTSFPSCPFCLIGSHHFMLPAVESTNSWITPGVWHLVSRQGGHRVLCNVIVLAPESRAPPVS